MPGNFHVVTDLGDMNPGLHLILDRLHPLHQIILFTAF